MPEGVDVDYPHDQGYAVFHSWLEGSTWSAWERLSGAGVTGLRAATWGPGRLDLFARGGGVAASSDPVWHLWWDGVSWKPSADTEWESLHGDFYVARDPEVVSWGPNRLDVFIAADMDLDGNAHVHHRWWNGTAWSLNFQLVQFLKTLQALEGSDPA